MKSTKLLHNKLINECKNNKPKAQLKLYKLYSKAMLLIANRYMKDRFLAEDIMQDAFIKAFKNIDSYKEEVAFGAWLKKIVINHSIDELKKKKLVTISMHDEAIDKAQEDNWEVEDGVTIEMIISAIYKQKEKYRLVLSLYLIEGYDHKEISQILGITEVTSRTHLMRGKKLVVEHIKNTNYAAGY